MPINVLTPTPDTSPILSNIATLLAARPDTTPILADAAEYLTGLRYLLESFLEPTTGRLRVVLDPLGGTQTLGTVTNVTSMSQVGAVPANSMVFDNMHAAWSLAVRGSGNIS